MLRTLKISTEAILCSLLYIPHFYNTYTIYLLRKDCVYKIISNMSFMNSFSFFFNFLIPYKTFNPVLSYCFPFCLPTFVFRLNSVDYKDLKDKVASPLINARNVVIQQSITERFILAFRHQVDANPMYSLPEGSPVSIQFN